jgi:outer membrane protein assembly factor BamB
MWRYDANRSANSTEQLPSQLQLAWVREYSPRQPVWDDPLNQDLLTFDTLFEPVVLGERMFLGFNDRDKLVALDTRTGRELWTFYTDGPVRLAPAAWQDKVYFTSDDGHLYCVRAADGVLVWKTRGGPSDRKALGNNRLVSAWPARGGPVIRDGVVYYAASIWPLMGTFIYALDAATGRTNWVNDSTGAQYIKQPHNTPAFAGVAPQGPLVATRELLLVNGGRSVPAAFTRQTGEFQYFRLSDSDKGTGGSVLMADESNFLVHTRQRGTRAHELKTGKKTALTINEPVLGTGHWYTSATYSTNRSELARAMRKFESATYEEMKARAEMGDAINANDTNAIKDKSKNWNTKVDDLGKARAALEKEQAKTATNVAYPVIQAYKQDKSLEWELEADGSGDLIRAGNRLYGAGSNGIVAIEMAAGRKPAIAWKLPVEGSVRRLLAANGQLFAVTLEGRILAFGRSAGKTNIVKEEFAAPVVSPAARESAQAILKAAGTREGYAFCLGLDDGALITALAAESRLHLIGVDADTNKVQRLRRELDAAGLYGKRVSLLAADPGAFGAPPYIANFIVAGGSFAARLGDPAVLGKVYESVRPYGGVLWIQGDANTCADLAAKARAAQLPRAVVRAQDQAVVIVREGALPGAADWTHQYGSAANTVKSDDRTVRLPLGVLWFGGNSHTNLLPRHGHGPSEQVAGGRLFLEGMDCLSARDVYTGRPLWRTVIPGLDTFGVYYDETLLGDPFTTLYTQRHLPGANSRGANFVATTNLVYVAVQDHCVVVDAVSGEISRKISLPSTPGQRTRPEWGHLSVSEDVLLGGVGFAQSNKRYGLAFGWPPAFADFTASAGLAAFNRVTGELLWNVPARHGFFHNGIVVGNGRVYCLDRLPKSAESRYKLKEGRAPSGYRIVAFDLHSGNEVWTQTNDVFGTWLSYSPEHDVLLLAGASARDRLKDEADKGMMVLRATDGKVMWKNLGRQYNGPCILYRDLILTTPDSEKISAGAFRLLDGEPHTITNALTGEAQRWRIHRTYGCNMPVASEHLMTFRSGAAGFYDLENHGGTGNLGGFRSGCTANLIIADGVLNAPDYTRTCSCAYQNQTSLGLVHMPEAEVWTCNAIGLDTEPGRRIRRVGINFGAPGDRLDTNGTLWVEYPPVPGYSPRLPLTVETVGTNEFRRHSSAVSGDGPAWVTASGLRGVRSLVLRPISMRTGDKPAGGTTKQPDKYKHLERTNLVNFDYSWRYETNGLSLGEEWRQEAFDDLAWPAGQGVFGREDKPEEYPQPFRTFFTNYSPRTLTYYFRTTFVYTNRLTNLVLLADNYIDDGALFYLNGREAGAVRVNHGARFDTEAAGPAAEKVLDSFEVPGGLLRQGTNTLAVEVHQAGRNSSDIVFGMKLDAIFLKPPVSTNKTATTNGTDDLNGNLPEADDDDPATTNGTAHAAISSSATNVSLAAYFPDARTGTYPDLRPAYYTVRLYFLEPDPVDAGQRVFDVRLQNRRVKTGFDIIKAAGAPNRGVTVEIPNVLVRQTLDVKLDRTTGSTLEPVLSGLELILEKED